MSTITVLLDDGIVGNGDKKLLTFKPRVPFISDGTIIYKSSTGVKLTCTGGVSTTVSLPDGPWEVRGLGLVSIPFDVDGDDTLTELIGPNLDIPPSTPVSSITAAVNAYLAAHPPSGGTGGATNEGVAALVTSSGATRDAVDARIPVVGDGRYVPLFPSASGVDTTILQARIDAAATAGGGTVRLGDGQTYVVTGLTMKTGVHLDLNGSVIQLANSTTASVIATDGYASLIGGDTTDGPRDWSIRNGVLDGNKANQSGTSASFPPVLAIYGRRYTLDNLLVRNGYGKGIDSQWSTSSPFSTPNGFESWITRVYVHSCQYDGINFRGPHDTFMQNFYVVKCGEAADSVPIRFPDASGRANGTNVDKFHIYGGNGYNFGLLVNTAGMRISNFVVEGSQTAQVLVQASQVMLDGFHLYAGGIAGATVKGIQVGDSSHTGINGSTIRGRIENCGGGALDVTYMGWNNDIDVHHFYLSSVTPTRTDLGYVGTLTGRNQFKLRTTDSGTGSGGTYLPTAAQRNIQMGPLWAVRSNSSDTAELFRLMDESNTALVRFDWRGRRRVSTAMTPTITAGAGAGTSPTVAITGDDTAGKITITVGTSPAAGLLATATFSGVFGNAAFVTLTPGDANTASGEIFATTSTSGFSVRCVGTPEAGETLSVFYSVVGA